MANMDTKDPKKVGTITGSRALVDGLLREGIDHVFGIPGTQNLAFLDVLRETPQIRFILTRHEQGAAFMALGFARARNAPAVVTATEGPGVTNLVTAIAAANKGNVPLISICGVQESDMRERDATQDLDQIPFMKPITKWAYSIPYPERIQEMVRKAFRVAMTEPQGPTHLEAPNEVMLQQVKPEPIAPVRVSRHRARRVRSRPARRRMGADQQGRAPDVRSGPRRDERKSHWRNGKARHGHRHPGGRCCNIRRMVSPPPIRMTLGVLGRNGFSSANKNAPKADVIIAVGSHFDVFSTMYEYGVFSKDAKIIHHTSAPGQIGIVFPVEMGVAGSAASFIKGLLERAGKSGGAQAVGGRGQGARRV